MTAELMTLVVATIRSSMHWRWPDHKTMFVKPEPAAAEPGHNPWSEGTGRLIDLHARRLDHLAPSSALGRDVGRKFIGGRRRRLGADILELRDHVRQFPHPFHLGGDLLHDRAWCPRRGKQPLPRGGLVAGKCFADRWQIRGRRTALW